MRQKLVEKILVDIRKDNVIVENIEQLIEAKNDKQKYNSKITLKNVPVSKYTENANGRVYSKALWENVAKSKAFEGSACFADHKDDPSVLDTVGIWNNFKILDEVAVADLSLVGKGGELLKEIIEVNGKCGFSTVGYGELSESDNKTVIENSYEYEHTDWVHNPSQGTYATQENMIEKANNVSIEETENKIKEKSKLKEEVKNMDKFFEINLKNHVTDKIQKARNSKNLSEAIASLSGIEGLTEIPSLKEKVDNTVYELQVKLDEQKQNAESQLESMQEKYDIATKTLDELKAKYNKMTSVTKKLGIDDINDVKTLKENAAVMSDDVYKLLGIVKDLKSKLLETKQDRLAMNSDITIFEEERNAMLSDIEIFEEECANRDADIEIFIEERETMLSDIEKLSEMLKEAKRKAKKYEKFLESEGYEITEEEDEDEDEEDDKEKDVKKESAKKKKKEADEEDEDEDEDSDDDKMAKIRAAKKESAKKKKESDDEDEEDEDEEEKAEKKESMQIRKYVAREVKKNPSLKSIRSELLESDSLEEAIGKVYVFKNSKLNESVSKVTKTKSSDASWTKGRF